MMGPGVARRSGDADGGSGSWSGLASAGVKLEGGMGYGPRMSANAACGSTNAGTRAVTTAVNRMSSETAFHRDMRSVVRTPPLLGFGPTGVGYGPRRPAKAGCGSASNTAIRVIMAAKATNSGILPQRNTGNDMSILLY